MKSNTQNRKPFKKIMKVIAGCLIAPVVLLAIWQLNEHRKLKSILLPEDTEYQVPGNLPFMLQEAVKQNRAHYLTRPTEQQLEEWASQIAIGGLSSDQDTLVANTALISMQSGVEQPEYITLAQAEEDLDFLLEYMRYSFALYEYRGGDDVFLPLFEAMKQEIETSGLDKSNLHSDLYRNPAPPHSARCWGFAHLYRQHEL